MFYVLQTILLCINLSLEGPIPSHHKKNWMNDSFFRGKNLLCEDENILLICYNFNV